MKNLCRSRHDTIVKERMLLVLKVVYKKQISALVVRDLQRSRTRTSGWLEIHERRIRWIKKTESGRHLDVPEETIFERKNQLVSYKQGWITKQIEDLIVK